VDWWVVACIVMVFVLAWAIQFLAWAMEYDLPYGYCLLVSVTLGALVYDALRKWWP
jgi:hypothetical protein